MLAEDVEQLARLLWRALVRRHGQEFPLRGRERIHGKRPGLGRRAETDPSDGGTVELRVLQTAHVEREDQFRAAGETGERFRALEHRAPLVVPPARPELVRPAAFGSVAVDGVGDAETVRLRVGERAAEFQLVRDGGILHRISLDREFRQVEGALCPKCPARRRADWDASEPRGGSR